MKERGIQVEWLYKGLMGLGLPEESLAEYLTSNGLDKRIVLPVEGYLKLLEWSAKTLNTPHIGLKISTKITPSDFGLLGFLIQYSATVEDMLEAMERYQIILISAVSFNYQVANGLCEICNRVLHSYNEGTRHDIEFSLAIAVASLSKMLGKNWQPIRVNFTHAMEGSIDEYKKILGTEVYFKQKNNSIIIDDTCLKAPINDSNPQLMNMLCQQADQILCEIEDKEDFIKQVRLSMTTHLGDGSYTINTLCQHFNITTRTLHRHLKKYNTSYKTLREQIILNLAKEALLKTDASVTEISLQLGYAESSSFVRAFNRLGGMTPLQYRNIHSK